MDLHSKSPTPYNQYFQLWNSRSSAVRAMGIEGKPFMATLSAPAALLSLLPRSFWLYEPVCCFNCGRKGLILCKQVPLQLSRSLPVLPISIGISCLSEQKLKVTWSSSVQSLAHHHGALRNKEGERKLTSMH